MRTIPAFLLLVACNQGPVGGDDTAATDDTAVVDDTAATDDTDSGSTDTDSGSTDTDSGSTDTGPDTVPCTTIDAIVTDIDATLTTSDFEFLVRVIDEGYDPAMRPDADTLMQGYADKGYAIFYVTARGDDIPMAGGLTAEEVTEGWLTAHGFPFRSGRVFLADGIGALGSDAETYKADVLGQLQAEGYVFRYGYGNADTDIAAYRDADMADETLFLVGDLAGEMGVTGITNDDAYTAHLPFLSQVPDAACPDE